jgi:TPR repeat protein
MSDLGFAYELGQGTEKDMNKSFQWYRKGAEAGDEVAMYNLGRCFQSGLGTEKDMTQAILWYHKAADAGDTSAKRWLADHAGN